MVNFAELTTEDRKILYAAGELDRAISRALNDGLDSESCFVALMMAAAELLAPVPPEEREQFLRDSLNAALGTN
jgi:site-specific recombinase